MILAWDNKADGGTLTAGSETTSQPGANVQSAHLSRKWGTAAGVNSSYLVFDLLASLSCSMLAVLGTNLTSAATVRLRGSVTDPTATGSLAYDSGTIAAGVKAGYGAIYKGFAAVAARYWRLDLADATLSSLAVGRVFLGPSWTPSQDLLFGWNMTSQDPSKLTVSTGGQTYADVRPQKRMLQFELDFLSESEMYDNAFAMARASGIAKDVLAIRHDTASAYLSEQSVFGLLTPATPITHRLSQIFRQQFTIEERL